MTEAEMQNIENTEQRKMLAAAYYRVFECTDDGRKVLEDLKTFCGADVSSVRSLPVDEKHVIYLEGMRRVWLHINKWLNMKFEEI